MIYRVLDIISRANASVLLFCILFLAQRFILSLIFSDLKAWGTIGRFYVCELVISAVAIWFIYCFVTISSPWEKYIEQGRR